MTIEITNQIDATKVLLVTGPSGAGRSTAINAAEDFGFEVIDNLPLSLLPRLLTGNHRQPLALGLDVRNRDFSAAALIEAIDLMSAELGDGLQVLFLDADDDALLRRYSETRRRHPLAPSGTPLEGISAEKELLIPIRSRADFLIDTSQFSPHQLKAEIVKLFLPHDGKQLSVTVQSFSYKRGLPRGLDMVLDCRFLRNPHWDEDLRSQDGRDEAVVSYVKADARFAPFVAQTKSLLTTVLPAHVEEGRAHFSLGFGCTGGQHRSVALTEIISSALAQDGWLVSKRHREIERRKFGATLGQKGQ